jgi:hypothetical protein
MTEQSTDALPQYVRRIFRDAIRLNARWTPAAGTSVPTVRFRNLVVSLSGVCALVLAYKNEPLPTMIFDELWSAIDMQHIKLKAELATDPSYATAAKCLDTLVQGRRVTEITKVH